jgi:hypothetical protein
MELCRATCLIAHHVHACCQVHDGVHALEGFLPVRVGTDRVDMNAGHGGNSTTRPACLPYQVTRLLQDRHHATPDETRAAGY